MKNKKQKRLLGTALLSLALIFALSTTLAYLTDAENIRNLLGLGVDVTDPTLKVVDITISEPGFDSVIGYVAEPSNPGKPHTLPNILPGDRILKDPQVTNSGSEGVYTRVRIYADDGAEGTTPAPLTAQQLLDRYGIVINSTNWKIHTLNGVETFYYVGGTSASAVLAKQTAPVPLFVENTVAPAGSGGPYVQNDKYTMTISTSLTYQSEGVGLINLRIVAEAIQARNFTPDLLTGPTDPWKGATVVSNQLVP